MQSPCVAKCGLNDDDFCVGCFRHIDEIVGWSAASDERKQHICQQAAARKQDVKGTDNKQIISRAKWLAAEARIADRPVD
ncbi:MULTISPECIES: DUF1289 domain-containing protein [Shewanella]|uniref:DUF1289 domain-containing protein n=1 Tax=Shewanella TaxID=22 RepID=UPI00048AA48C|nr:MULTISPECIES: DUF1289 domain-containing protein [Shewanella]QLE85255.1 DUF1289 domain-containing protein [Shewanella sp. Scap07]